MTELLYLKDHTLKEFEAKVTEVRDNKVILDQTAFYPTGGGQPHDTGMLTRSSDGQQFKVIEVKKEGPAVLHKLENQNGLRVGDTVKGTIDWERRYALMRMHTAAHLLCATVNKNTGGLITGHQLKPDETRIDFNLERFDRSQLQQFADEVNAAIATYAKIKTYWLPREEALALPGMVKLASVLPPQLKELRIVEIEGYDKQADGGTHVASLKELGKLVITRAENKGKANRRVYFKLET